MDEQWKEDRVPWKAGNQHGYQLLSRRGDDGAVTVHFEGPRFRLLFWEWHNHYGRDWSPGEGIWKLGHSYATSFYLTREELARLNELVAAK